MHAELQAKIKNLHELMWDQHADWTDIERWLAHFATPAGDEPDEQLHALFLLSHFSFFNWRLMRVLLRALYRDRIRQPLLSDVRRRLANTRDCARLQLEYDRVLESVRFVGIGNPSESGTHLLYYFRQENRLSTKLFLHADELLDPSRCRPRLMPGIERIYLLDDFCGSGTQAERYSRRLLGRLRKASKTIRVSYCPLFATSRGLRHVRENAAFDEVDALCELDESFRSLAATSRYFREERPAVDRAFAESMCLRYGELLAPGIPLGFGGCQLLLGFAHNIPNNTLPIFWADGRGPGQWAPLFRRYAKDAG